MKPNEAKIDATKTPFSLAKEVIALIILDPICPTSESTVAGDCSWGVPNSFSDEASDPVGNWEPVSVDGSSGISTSAGISS